MTPSSTPSPSSEKLPRRVLVVQDNDDGREMLRLLLTLWGHEVAVAPDGEAAVEKAREFRPDAAVIDLGLPRMDGLQVARELRAAFGDSILLVAVTGLAQPDHRRRTREAGFNAHLRKPADTDELQRLLADA
jgi:CheY-like chemotaxis protein